MAGITIPPTSQAYAVDPKATPTPNWCCDLIYSKYCPLCPQKEMTIGAANQLNKLYIQFHAAFTDPKECPAKCFRDTRGICWCPK